MKTKILAILFLLVAVVVSSGCVQQPSGPTCNPPYIVKGYDCCLDQNSNKICDSDEQQVSAYCGDLKCDSNESCSSCPQDCGACPVTINDSANSSINNMKSLVYQTIKKYIPKAPVGDFKYEPRPNVMTAFDTWEYPDFSDNLNTSKYVLWASIKDYHFDMGGPGSIYDKLSEAHGYGTGELYIEVIENGRILATDKKVPLTGIPGVDGRYEFGIEFTCKSRYDITIKTWDFYGTSVLPLYQDYDIDKTAFEKIANEIFLYC